MTGIVDYNAGNVRSVENALAFLGAPYILGKTPHELARCDRLIFPGVGDAAYAMKQLKAAGFDSFLKDWVAAQKPLAGVCLGSQIIFDWTEEGDTECLGLLKGKIRHFNNLWKAAGGAKMRGATADALKVPHMGWNDIAFSNGGSPLLAGVAEHSDFYFVHSYVIVPDDETVVKAYCDYGVAVPAVIECGSVSAFQFHPEKSGTVGLTILANFCKEDINKNGGENEDKSADSKLTINKNRAANNTSENRVAGDDGETRAATNGGGNC